MMRTLLVVVLMLLAQSAVGAQEVHKMIQSWVYVSSDGMRVEEWHMYPNGSQVPYRSFDFSAERFCSHTVYTIVGASTMTSDCVAFKVLLATPKGKTLFKEISARRDAFLANN